MSVFNGFVKQGGSYEWQENDEITIDEDVIYLGYFFSHWGHFLVDLSVRYWAIPGLNNNLIKVAYIGEEDISGNYLEFLKLLGVDKTQVMHITTPTRFKNVYIPEQSFRSCQWYTKEYVNMFDVVIQKALSSDLKIDEFKNVKRLYFTRMNYNKAKKSEFGEGYFANVFENNGFSVLTPEKMSLSQQIYIWNHAEEIICMNGTIPLNLIFSYNRQIKLTVLNKMSLFHENPYVYLQIREIRANFIDIYSEPIKGFPKSLGEGPYLLWPTKEFDEYFFQTEKLTDPLTEMRRKMYFRKQFVRYCICTTGILQKIRLTIGRMTPSGLKKLRRKLLN